MAVKRNQPTDLLDFSFKGKEEETKQPAPDSLGCEKTRLRSSVIWPGLVPASGTKGTGKPPPTLNRKAVGLLLSPAIHVQLAGVKSDLPRKDLEIKR